MWAIDAADPGTPAVVNETGRTVGSFGEDEAGEVYLADLGSGESTCGSRPATDPRAPARGWRATGSVR